MTVEEIRNMNIKLRGYAMPNDNAPDFYKRCKLGEALEIMKDYVKGLPEEFYNLIFTITDENDESLFDIRRNLKTIYLDEDNRLNLTEELIKEALGITEELS